MCITRNDITRLRLCAARMPVRSEYDCQVEREASATIDKIEREVVRREQLDDMRRAEREHDLEVTAGLARVTP